MITNRPIFYSRKMRSDFAFNTDRPSLGSSHYSYGNVADAFLKMLEESGLVTVEIERPEIYTNIGKAGDDNSNHIIFKPYEEFRFLRGARNIAHVAWEFDKFSVRSDWKQSDRRRMIPFCDYVSMLNCLDEAWVGSNFAAKVIRSYSSVPVRVIPAPIWPRGSCSSQIIAQRKVRRNFGNSLADRMFLKELNPLRPVVGSTTIKLSSLATNNRKIFLFVGNHGDLRKNIPSLIDGFSMASIGREDASLVIKLVMDNKHVTEQSFFDLLPRRYSSMGRNFNEAVFNNIYYTTEYLTDAKMQALYELSDFYLTASVAEGQNLPLLEAMAAGAVPVSANHTAMADFVFGNNSIIIPSALQDAPQEFVEAYGIEGLSIYNVAAEDVTRAVSFCLKMTEQEIELKQHAAWKTVFQNYSPQVVSTLVSEALNV